VADRANVLIRADAGAGIGAGHWTRCLALAQACRDAGDRVTLVSRTGIPWLSARWKSEGVEVVRIRADRGGDRDAREVVRLARDRRSSWIILDGYCFGAEYQRAVKESGSRVMLVDDVGGARAYGVDAILNQNLGARKELYEGRSPACRLLLGPRYALLRREFRSRPRARRAARVARRILVTLGGGDWSRMIRRIVRAIEGLEGRDWEARVVLGTAPDAAGVPASRQVTYERNVPDMRALMAWADLAVTGAGSTCWETAFMGLPCVLIVLAENQRSIAGSLAGRGAAVSVGWHERVTERSLRQAVARILESPDRRAALARRGRDLVDGRGAARVHAWIRGA
jgi:UDP-2,4-diacetamido-2,4,6-trideoxy-beta-L-altropyranose hydrolase